MKILITGGTGQVGFEVMRDLAPLGDVVAPTHAELDLTTPAAIREIARSVRPRIVVNAAAYNAVDRAESERALCAAVNADAPGVLAEEASRLGAVFVHYSTDYVFDGRKRAPYVERDPTGPLNVYAETKLAGEQAVQAAGGAYLVLRTSWVYGSRGTNFVRTMLRLARERRELRVVNDQFSVPTWSRSVARATGVALRQALEREAFAADGSGVYHLAATGPTTRYEFTLRILEGDPRREEQVCTTVTPVSSADFGATARRPAYSVLDSSAFARRFGVALPDWREELKLVLGELR